MKKFLLAFTGLLIASLSYSQGLVHVKGQNALDLRYFHAGNGKAYELGYARFLRDDFVFKTGLNYEKGKHPFNFPDFAVYNTSYQNYTLKLGAEKTVYPILNGKGFFNIQLPLFASINTFDNLEFQSKENKFVYGGGLGVGFEIYFLSRFGLVIDAQQFVSPNNPFGKFHYNVGGGLRYII
jgi:hypothetical protein